MAVAVATLAGSANPRYARAMLYQSIQQQRRPAANLPGRPAGQKVVIFPTGVRTTTIPAVSPRALAARAAYSLGRGLAADMAVRAFMASIAATPIVAPNAVIVPAGWQGAYPTIFGKRTSQVWFSGQPGASTKKTTLTPADLTDWLAGVPRLNNPTFVNPDVPSVTYVGLYDNAPPPPGTYAFPTPVVRVLDMQLTPLPYAWPMPAPQGQPAPWVYPAPQTNPGTYVKTVAEPSPRVASGYVPRNISLQMGPNGRLSIKKDLPSVKPPPHVKEGRKPQVSSAMMKLLNAATESLDFLEVLYRASGGQKRVNIKGWTKSKGKNAVGGRVSGPEKMEWLFGKSQGWKNITPDRLAAEWLRNELEDKIYGHVGRKLSRHDPTRRGAHGDPNRPVGIGGGPLF